MKLQHNWVAVGCSTALCLFLAWILWSHFLAQNDKSDTNSLIRVRDEDYLNQIKNTSLDDKITEELKEDDIRIVAIYEHLQKNEGDRTSFCREYEDENNIYFDFLIKSPNLEESRTILNVAASAPGMTKDWFTKQSIAWNARLQEEFLFTGDCSHYHVSISYSKTTGRGDFSVMGIEAGDLHYIPGDLPISLSGKYKTIFLGRSFKFNENWRFKHLLELN
jgi:hypothetical protein